MTRTDSTPSSFGSIMPTRVWSDASRAYRYMFNGKEKDFETANDDFPIIVGYYPLDNQVIFSTKLAIATGSTVYTSQGYTSPEIDEETKEYKKNTSITSTLTWTKTTSDETRIKLENKPINLIDEYKKTFPKPKKKKP